MTKLIDKVIGPNDVENGIAKERVLVGDFNVRIAANLGWVRFHEITVTGSLIAEAGTDIAASASITAGRDITVGTDITAGTSLTAGLTIACKNFQGTILCGDLIAPTETTVSAAPGENQ